MKTRIRVRIAGAVAVGVMTPAVSIAGSPPPQPPPVSLGVSSQQAGPSRASVTASIATRSKRRGHEATNASDRGQAQAISVPHGRGAGSNGPLYPRLASTSPFLHNPHPLGPNTFWYSDGSGHTCIYMANSVLPCYTVTA